MQIYNSETRSLNTILKLQVRITSSLLLEHSFLSTNCKGKRIYFPSGSCKALTEGEVWHSGMECLPEWTLALTSSTRGMTNWEKTGLFWNANEKG